MSDDSNAVTTETVVNGAETMDVDTALATALDDSDAAFLLEEVTAEELMKEVDASLLFSPGRQVSQETRASSEQQQQQALSGRPPVSLYLSCNPDHLSPYQVLVRKQIELFEAQEHEVAVNAQGRNKPIVLGQVGIRCRHCSPCAALMSIATTTADATTEDTLSSSKNAQEGRRGSVYYPAKLLGLYQAAQNMATVHLMETCPRIPSEIRQELISLKSGDPAGAFSRPSNINNKSGMGKDYWAETAKALGVYEDEQSECLRFVKGFRWDYVSHEH